MVRPRGAQYVPNGEVRLRYIERVSRAGLRHDGSPAKRIAGGPNGCLNQRPRAVYFCLRLSRRLWTSGHAGNHSSERRRHPNRYRVANLALYQLVRAVELVSRRKCLKGGRFPQSDASVLGGMNEGAAGGRRASRRHCRCWLVPSQTAVRTRCASSATESRVAIELQLARKVESGSPYGNRFHPPPNYLAQPT